MPSERPLNGSAFLIGEMANRLVSLDQAGIITMADYHIDEDAT